MNSLSENKIINEKITANQDTSFINRREYPRFSLNNMHLPIELEFSKSGENQKEKQEGKIINISKKGVLIGLDKILSSERVDFMLHIPDSQEPLGGKARIMWEVRQNGNFFYGLYFYHLQHEGVANKIEEYLIDINKKLELIDRRKIFRRLEKENSIDTDRRRADRRLNKSLFLKCARYSRIEKLIANNTYFYLRELESGAEHTVLRKGKKLINFASNNYLGLSTHPAVKEAAIKAIEKYGSGSGGSRLLSGNMDLHEQLEKKLINFKQGEDCMLSSSGYHTNVGVISSLMSKGEYIIMDDLSHASIVDGSWLSEATLLLYKHNNILDLEKKLSEINLNAHKLIVADGVFSMDGDIAKLDVIYELGKKYNAAIMVDDAHGVGVMGETGRGTPEHYNLQGKIDIIVGTLSKALGGIGGFVIANKKAIHFLKHNSRPFIFSASIPPNVCASVLKSIDIIENEPIWHKQLWFNINYLKQELLSLGLNIGNSESAIIPIILKDEILTYKVAGKLEEKNIFINSVAFPAVRKNEARLRISVMATHTQDELYYFINILKTICKNLHLI